MNLKKNFKLISTDAKVVLTSISKNDIENIRIWKNEHRNSFFYNKIITPKEQAEWFENYLKRENDFIFIISFDNKDIGCIAFREIEGMIDIYNVILGNKKFGGKGIMSNANRLMCSLIMDNYSSNITVKVLKTNPAVKWYLKNNFYEIGRGDTYLLLKLDNASFKKENYRLVIQ